LKQEKKNLLKEKINESINKLDEWVTNNNWKGWDPYDIQCSYFLHRLAKRSKLFRYMHSLIFKYSNKKIPKFSRKLLRIKKQINPKAMGLFASAYCSLYNQTKDSKYLKKAVDVADWLLNNNNKDFENLCWGYPFNWLSKIYIPKNTPSGVVTSNVGRGLWDLYTTTKKQKYLDACVSICKFFIKSLNKTQKENGICFNYTTIDDFEVHNASLFAAEFLVTIGNHIKNDEWISLAKEAVKFSLSEQNTDGSICYWSKDQMVKYSIPCTVDHFHSGFEIRMLYNIWKISKDDNIKKAIDRYYQFYRDNFFSEDGAPILEPRGNYYVDIHSCAEALICNSLLVDDYPKAEKIIEKTTNWTIENMQTPNGWYRYVLFKKRNKIKTINIPYMRWGQAWMLLALSKALEKVSI
jgi:rhamnogalacturonyl hydrolase YesR